MSFPRKTGLAFAVCVAALAAAHWWRPGLGLFPSVLSQPWRLGGGRSRAVAPTSDEGAAKQAVPVLPSQGQQTAGTQAVVTARPPLAEFLYDNAGSLDGLFAALGKLEPPAPSGQVTILHYGDSPTTADLITGDVRALLQQRFGDAGHGYLLVAKPWAWYGHRDTDLAAHGWTVNTAVGKGHADTYGLGGASFVGTVGGAASRITFKDGLQTSVELSYLGQPDGGTVSVAAAGDAGQVLATVNTAGTPGGPAWQTIALPPGTTAIDLKPVSGRVELFGESFARARPGVLYDSLGLNGASTTVLSRGFNAEVWTAELRHTAPALVVINYGTNESSFGSFVDKQYEPELRTAIGRIRNALPGVSILVMSPMDRGERSGIDEIDTMATIPRIVAIQRRVAAETGCAFFDTFDAMGGNGTMSRWYGGKPRLVSADLIHPTPQGALVIAQVFVKDLLEGYDAYRKRMSLQPVQAAPTQAATR